MDVKPAKSPLDPQIDLANTHCEDKLANCKEYLSMVGSLMYAALRSRPDIAFSVTALSQYNVPTARNTCNSGKENTPIPEDYCRISNSLPTAPFLLTTTSQLTSSQLTSSQLTLHQHYRIYRLRLGRKPYDSQISRRMCVWPGTYQCK